jgi:molecular chaperone DnaK
MTSPTYLGIDLGTTNSAAAIFDGSQLSPVRNSQGGTLTPSVVRIDGRGNVTVGARARRFLETDPKNTRGEFKRLMGTKHALDFAAFGASKRPEELAGEVLKTIRADVTDQAGFAPELAVISVPALFEIAQTAATSEAARLAGFSRVEMIQEPVASAIAAGWSANQTDESWLVYDLGGGTFDVTLLSTREGLLQVIGHDGDNFLGGRDFDGKLVDWILDEIERQGGGQVDRSDPGNAVALRKLRFAAEEAKIELSRAGEFELSMPELALGGAPLDVDVRITRETLEHLVAPLVARSITVCQRLLAHHGTPRLGRIVLVGGPTGMPFLRSAVSEALDAPFREGLDPMTLVAQGAALYAATAQLDARPKPSSQGATGPTGRRVWLQYPAMTPDLAPYVVGKIVDVEASSVMKVVLRRADGGWTGAPEALDAEGAFAVPVALVARSPNVFYVEGITGADGVVPLTPKTLTIVHGVTISDPPLSRSIGVALANDGVQLYFERGSPLPMRRTFTLRTVETVSHGVLGFALNVPIVQGELPLAHLCRLVGTLEIPSSDVLASLPAGSPIEITLELDRGGRLSATANVPSLKQVFDKVAHLVAPNVPVEELATGVEALEKRTWAARGKASSMPKVIPELSALDGTLCELGRDVEMARGGDPDSAEKVRRVLLEVDASLGEIETKLAWPSLEASVDGDIGWATSWLSHFGTDAERKVLGDTLALMAKARTARDARDLNRHLGVVRRLGCAAYYRHPGAWEEQLEHVACRVAEATDVPRAKRLVVDGKKGLERGNVGDVEAAVRGLWTLLPGDAEDRKLSYSSGVR